MNGVSSYPNGDPFSSPIQKLRTITYFPKPFLYDASPYPTDNFDEKVLAHCAAASDGRTSKVVFIGDSGVGKTTLVTRYCRLLFRPDYRETIGVDFEVEKFYVQGCPLNLQIWDTAGQERFRSIAAAYYRGASAIVIVFDSLELGSLVSVEEWLQEALKANSNAPLRFLVAAKKDVVSPPQWEMVVKKATALAQKLNMEFWPLSSKTGENVPEFFQRLAALSFNHTLLREVNALNVQPMVISSPQLINGKEKTIRIMADEAASAGKTSVKAGMAAISKCC